ncbi:MAG: hypothetical protein NPIRA01_29120 [Nitrospirales bacterium]|nr:MAG: hypothetical protein NPIRA01_29120 [Nitrospirales bacterium]
MKVTIVIFSDPKNGSEEALGRVFNGLAAAYDFKQAGDEATIIFQGTGIRWIGELTKKDHPAHELFEAVKDQVAGVSCGCADVFGSSEEATKSGFDLIKNNPVPGTTGMSSFRKLLSEGSTVLTF